MRFLFKFITCAGLAATVASARADAIVLKNGVRIETSKVFLMAGAYYYDSGGKMLSISETEVERIEKGSAPLPAATPAPAEEAAQQIQEQTDLQFIHDCRLQVEAEAKKAGSDYKATCAKALRMVERMHEGQDPGDGSFGYYSDVLNNPLMWEILPAEQSEQLKAVVFEKDGPYDQYLQPYMQRIKEQSVRRTFAIANSISARAKQQEALAQQVRRQAATSGIARPQPQRTVTRSSAVRSAPKVERRTTTRTTKNKAKRSGRSGST